MTFSVFVLHIYRCVVVFARTAAAVPTPTDADGGGGGSASNRITGGD